LSKIFEVKNLKKDFGSIEAVKNVSFYVEKGEILGIIGPNGAGKTTLFNLIMGVHRQDDGKIHLKGQEISGLKTFQRVNIGMARTFQFARSFSSLTIMQHIRMAMLSGKVVFKSIRERERESNAKRITEVVKLGDSASKYPGELNIEELRKLELAMALAVKPDILLIDEMFAGLTEGESNDIIEIIRAMIKSGDPTTAVVIDHNLAALSKIVNRVVAIDLGEKIAEGTFKQVLSNEEVKKAYLGEHVQ
jgi:ABC-type branched-subunit amino acid transport system ATPase component